MIVATLHRTGALLPVGESPTRRKELNLSQIGLLYELQSMADGSALRDDEFIDPEELHLALIGLRAAGKITFSMEKAGDEEKYHITLTEEYHGKDVAGSAGFEKFWAAYPKKVGKKACLLKWKSKKLESEAGTLIQAVELQKKSVRWRSGYVKDPLTWLNGDCWNDDVNSLN